MAWGIADLFREGFAFRVDRLIARGGGVAELRERFRQLFPGRAIPHTNTFSSLLNRIRSSNDIAGRLNRNVKPRSASYPTVPAGFNCEGFLYRVIVPVNRPQHGKRNKFDVVDMPVEIQSDRPLSRNEIVAMVPDAIAAMQGTRDNYDLLRLGVSEGGFTIGNVRISDAYRC